jgi:hypothetical protein
MAECNEENVMKVRLLSLASAPRSAVALLIVFFLWSAWAIQPQGARGQEPEPASPPCDLSAQRDVSPLRIYAGEEVTVTTRIEADCSPRKGKGVDIMFVVDRSITVHEDKLLQPIKDGLSAFVLAMDFEGSSAGLITYASSDQVVSNLTHDQARVLNGIRTIRLAEENDIRGVDGAFRKAVGKLDNDGDPENEKIVMITVAGQDQSQQLVSMPTVTNSARNAGVKVVFLLFPGARYRHLVEAASDCDANCPMYGLSGGPQGKWAWYVDATDYEDRLKALADRLLRARMLDKVELEEYLHSGAVLVPGSLSPPAGQAGLRLLWSLDTIPEPGITLTYRARMIYPDETYPVADSVILEAVDDLGARYPVPLANPDIEVLNPASRPTEVPTATAIVPTATAVPATPTPTATIAPSPEPADDRIFLPLARYDA